MGYSGKIPANYWMHGEFLKVDGGKMSKSLGNIYTISELERREFDAIDFRYFCLNAHYRSLLNFTFKSLESAQIGLERLRNSVKEHANSNAVVDIEEIEKYRKEFMKALNDDLDTPRALSIVWDIARKEKKSKAYADLLSEMDEIIGIDISIEKNKRKRIKHRKKIRESLNDEIKKLIEEREIARKNKDWAKSDLLRDELELKGIRIKDTKEGTKIEKIKKLI